MSAEYERLIERKTPSELRSELHLLVKELKGYKSVSTTDKLVAIQREYEYRDLDYFADLDAIEDEVDY